MQDFEIAVFEYNDLYDSNPRVKSTEVVKVLIENYKRYLSPEYYAEDDVWFMRSRLFLSYRDKTGGDKPMTIMLIGPITDELVAEIKTTVERLHIKKCADCGKELPKKHKWPVCRDCINL